MELTMGAMAPLFPKLFQMLENKYVEQRGLKREVETLSMEMEMVHAALLELQNEGHRSLFEVGERYFNELLNRSMIQPANEERFGFITGCHVHDIVLDLIRDLSHKENFVTVLDEKKFLPSESIDRKHGLERKVRRMSVGNGTVPNDTTIRMPEAVRSLHTRGCRIEVPKLSSFQSCRVLSLCDVYYVGDLKYLGKLLHLRYLQIGGVGINGDCELPKEIGNLKSLQTLIIDDICSMEKLPPTVCELTQLMCLDAYDCSLVRADRLGGLVCLEQLKLEIHKKECDDFVVELGKLTRLRVLRIYFRDRTNEASEKALMQSLNNLQEIRELTVLWDNHGRDVTLWESWEPPQQLWKLHTNRGLPPHLMDPSSRFLHLLSLRITVDGGGDMPPLLVPELQDLHIKLKFLQGAMPRLEFLGLRVRPGRDSIPDLEEMNLATLLSLKEVNITVDCGGSFRGEVEEAEAVLRRAVEDHPNPPTLRISRLCEWLMLSDDKMKPEKVVHALVKVRECRRDTWGHVCDDVNMRLYRWLEEITCDIDCEGCRLSELEEIEAKLRSDAGFHPKRPKLVMNRVNQDKMLGDDDGVLQ
ncbi:hypothetical protein QOZ80_5BG0457130 [Eleusine coracana subsp. coracana]|nr:hypothetical protein QOZ80_5BG0457130 [Eleusine coracana subsp. coracana]